MVNILLVFAVIVEGVAIVWLINKVMKWEYVILEQGRHLAALNKVEYRQEIFLKQLSEREKHECCLMGLNATTL